MTEPRVSVIMPAKGRPEQTAALIPRLIQTAGKTPWELIIVVDDDTATMQALTPFQNAARIAILHERHGYWKALAAGTQHARGSLLANIANDVLPGLSWLDRAVHRFDREFPDGRGIVGWNDGLIFDGHTGHLLCSRSLLTEWYGKACWPTGYDHLYGDTEICHRAIAESRYVVEYRAVLYHNHPVVGQAVDGVYRFSHTKQDEDERLFAIRRSNAWRS